jgi:N-methylhydantoinase B
MLRDAHFMSIADRSVLACWGVKGGRAGRPFSVVIDPGRPNERTVDALADAEPVRAGEVIRIRTTGGGGWGDPLERPYGEVAGDVAAGKVSVAGARADYGVVIGDPDATEAVRASLRDARTGDEPFFDRGPGYPTLAGGRTYAEVDVLLRRVPRSPSTPEEGNPPQQEGRKT